jgi:hypothetical protein
MGRATGPEDVARAFATAASKSHGVIEVVLTP